MILKSNKNFFQPRARLLLQLGDKLIKNENVALLELVKNSYDADAKNVKISLEKLTSKTNGIIDIVDDGEGMDLEIIENVWLEPGSDYKAALLKEKVRSTKYHRLPIGEKGIGRFGVHKLGNKIQLISRKKGENEIVVKIDWNEFSKNKYLKDAKFEVFERTPEYFIRDRTGTRIIISDLRNDWDRRMIRELYKSIFTLNSPFQKKGNFNVKINIDDSSLVDDLPNWDSVQKLALWHFKCKLQGTEIREFSYEFTPWENMLDEISYKIITEKDDFIKNNSTLIGFDQNLKEEKIINLAKSYDTNERLTIGEITFEGYIFDRDKSILELSHQNNINLIKQYLNEQGGIRVYRSNIRVNEYGERGNDWLNLDIRRVNSPTKRISNNIILGVVDIDIEQSSALIEKTNREGFIENDAFHDFSNALLYVLGIIETLRKIDKDLIRSKYSPTQKNEPVLFHLSQLQVLVNKRIPDEKLRSEISGLLNKIESDYNYINEILLTSAGAGLTLGVGIHEVQKIIAELNIAVEKDSVPEKILHLVKHLSNLIENYSDLLRQSENNQENIVNIVDGAFFNVEYRLEAHDINLIRAYKEYSGHPTIKCSRRLLLGAILNLIDNSIYWLERKLKTLASIDENFEKKIYIQFYPYGSDYIDILIADNGFGFSLPTSQLIKPFISDKTNGMGLGLHIVSEIMKAQQGFIEFPESKDYPIPEEFDKGAKVILRLKKIENDITQ